MTDDITQENSLRDIFSRSPEDSVFREKLSQLCASYLGGVWEKVNCRHIQIVALTGGANNLIFVVRLPAGTEAEYAEPREAVLRIYTNLSRDYELPEGIVAALLAERRLGPALRGIFPGGRFEEFIPSRTLTNDEYCKPCVAKEVGRILAKIHSLDMPVNRQFRLTHFLDDILEKLKRSARWSRSKRYPMHTTLVKVDKKLCPSEITIDLLAEELELCKKCLTRCGSPLVFSNNDLHEGNLLLRDGFEVTDKDFVRPSQDCTDPLVLIDYEYACYFHRGFDLCHYCVECCQHNEGKVWPFYEVKQEQWPSEEIQREYINAYLDEATNIWRSRGGKKSGCIMDLPDDHEAAVQQLLREVRQFAAFPQLFWGMWSFQQAEIYQIDFDFFEYGFDRLGLYYYWKSEMMKYLNQ